MNYRWHIKTNSIFFFFIFGVFILISILFNIDISFLFVFLTWSILMYYSLIDLKNRVLLAAFLTSFFIFLIGGHLVYEYLDMEIKYFIEYKFYFHSNITMGVSLICLFVGIKTSERIIDYIRPNTNEETSDLFNRAEVNNRELLRHITKFFYLITYIFNLYVVIDRAAFVMNNSYISSYVNYERNVSFVVTAIGAMTPYFFFLFLATLPSKKEVRPLIILQVISAGATLLTGSRIAFMTDILFIIIYYIIRHYYNDGEKWISKKHVTIFIISVPLLIIALFLYNYLRSAGPISDFSMKELIFGFFQQQGFSSNVIRLGLYHQNDLRDDTYYSFFGLVRFLRTNSFLKLFYNPQYDFSYAGNSVDYALNGNSLAHALSYHTLRGYLSGSGVGSCYIAELYHDFGYLGIVIGNIVYGTVITAISKLWMRVRKYNIWVTAIGFSLIGGFLKAPRWNYDIVFADMLSLGMWSAFFGVFVCYKFLKNKTVQNIFKENLLGRLIYGNQKTA